MKPVNLSLPKNRAGGGGGGGGKRSKRQDGEREREESVNSLKPKILHINQSQKPPGETP